MKEIVNHSGTEYIETFEGLLRTFEDGYFQFVPYSEKTINMPYRISGTTNYKELWQTIISQKSIPPMFIIESRYPGMLARVASKIPLLVSVLKKPQRQRKSLTFLKRTLCLKSTNNR